MDVLFVLGSQDVFPYDDSAVDDSLGWLADILTDEGITATYLFQAERAAQLAAHRRQDVIRKIARHEVGLHGRDRHPVDPEIVEDLGWYDGVARLREAEDEEMSTLARVFGREPVCSSQHGPYFAPQLYAVARGRGQPYLFGYPAAPPLFSLSWYSGALSVPYEAPTDGFLGFLGVYDQVLHDDEQFERALAQAQEYLDRCRAGRVPLVSVFICHPERLVYPVPLTRLRYANGENHPEIAWQNLPPPLRRTPGDVTRALANFRRLVQTLRDLPDVTPTGVGELTQRYGHEPLVIPHGDLITEATRVIGERAVVLGGIYSPAEVVVGWADSLARWQDTGEIPAHVPRRTVFGPLEVPIGVPDRSELVISEIIALGREILQNVSETGHLPGNLHVGGARIGLGSAYEALAQASLLLVERRTDQPVHLDAFPRYPAFATALANASRSVENSPTIRPDLKTDRIALYTRLQSWTLKPAARSA